MSRVVTVSLVVSAIATTFAVGFLTASAWHREAPQASTIQTVERSPVVATSDENPRRSSASDSDRAWARVLVEKMSALEERVDKLQTQPSTSSKAASGPPPSLTPEQQTARNQQRIQRIDRALDSEPHDGRWSQETTRVLEDLFASVVPAGSTLADTTCGETFCRLVVTHQDHDARDEFEIFPRKVPGMGVRGLIEHHDDGTEQTTLYVVRKEYDTPDHPVRLQDSTG